MRAASDMAIKFLFYRKRRGLHRPFRIVIVNIRGRHGRGAAFLRAGPHSQHFQLAQINENVQSLAIHRVQLMRHYPELLPVRRGPYPHVPNAP